MIPLVQSVNGVTTEYVGVRSYDKESKTNRRTIMDSENRQCFTIFQEVVRQATHFRFLMENSAVELQ